MVILIKAITKTIVNIIILLIIINTNDINNNNTANLLDYFNLVPARCRNAWRLRGSSTCLSPLCYIFAKRSRLYQTESYKRFQPCSLRCFRLDVVSSKVFEFYYFSNLVYRSTVCLESN